MYGMNHAFLDQHHSGTVRKGVSRNDGNGKVLFDSHVV